MAAGKERSATRICTEGPGTSCACLRRTRGWSASSAQASNSWSRSGGLRAFPTTPRGSCSSYTRTGGRWACLELQNAFCGLGFSWHIMLRPIASFSAGRWGRLPQSGPAGSTGVRVVSLGPTRRSKKHNFLWNYCRGVGLVLEATLDAKHKACRTSTSTRPSQDGPRKNWSRRTLSKSRGNPGGRHSPERQA